MMSINFNIFCTALEGEAALAIQNIDFNGNNYGTAWNILCKRYNNNGALINNPIQALYNARKY